MLGSWLAAKGQAISVAIPHAAISFYIKLSFKKEFVEAHAARVR